MFSFIGSSIVNHGGKKTIYYQFIFIIKLGGTCLHSCPCWRGIGTRGILGGCHCHSFEYSSGFISEKSMSSFTTPPPVFARFTIRRFAALLLASNGPGTKLPCFLESAANAKRESESLKMSSVIQRWYSVGAGALTRRGTARQQSCRLNDIRDFN